MSTKKEITSISIEINKVEYKRMYKMNETTAISFSRWMVKQNIVDSCHGMPLRNKTGMNKW